jgi:hypothetical protein
MDPREEMKSLSTPELVGQILERTQVLLKEQIALGRAEARQELRAEARALGALGIAAFCGFLCLLLLVTFAVAAFATLMPTWAAALLVCGILAIVGGVFAAYGYRRRVTQALPLTRETAKEDLQWAKGKMH